jgi:hypothetical protein
VRCFQRTSHLPQADVIRWRPTFEQGYGGARGRRDSIRVSNKIAPSHCANAD